MSREAKRIVEVVCDYYDTPDFEYGTVTLARMKNPDARGWPIDEARQMLVYLLFDELGWTTQQVADFLGRDRAAVWRLRRGVEVELAQHNYEYHQALASLRKKLHPAG